MVSMSLSMSRPQMVAVPADGGNNPVRIDLEILRYYSHKITKPENDIQWEVQYKNQC